MINKESIIEILKMYSSDVDNFNTAVFEDEFNTVAGLIQQLLNKHDVSGRSEQLPDDETLQSWGEEYAGDEGKSDNPMSIWWKEAEAFTNGGRKVINYIQGNCH